MALTAILKWLSKKRGQITWNHDFDAIKLLLACNYRLSVGLSSVLLQNIKIIIDSIEGLILGVDGGVLWYFLMA